MSMPLALSIKQPWAFFIMKEIKMVENRDWGSKHTGVFFIHVSRTFDYEWKQGLSYEASVRAEKHLNSQIISGKGKMYWHHGEIIGAAIHEGTDQLYNDPWCSSDPRAHFLRIASPVVKLVKPLACRGMLKFFRPNVKWEDFDHRDRSAIENLQYQSRMLKLEKGFEGQTL